MSQFATRLDFERAQAEHAGKQCVQYAKLLFPVELGRGASVIPVDHPDTFLVTNSLPAYTSPVEWFNADTGVFQTRNTRYVPQSLVA
jgi:hypothetical protein